MSGPQPRPSVLEITPYVGGESEIAGLDRVAKLASNEGALGPSPLALAAYKQAGLDMHRYPDGDSLALRRALAAHHGIEAGRIVCGSGSDELFGLICKAYAGPGDEIVHSKHGFLMYPIASRVVGARPVAAPENGITADVDALLAAVTAKTRILFLANPNNPTGTYLPGGEIRRLRDNLREDILLVLDAAYAEYVAKDDYESGADLVGAGANVVMTRTFSKIYALGGLRLGWAYCPEAVADALNRVRHPFNVTNAAHAAGLAALGDGDFLARSRAHNDTWLPWITGRLRDIGLTVPDSVCNFVLVRFPESAGHDSAGADKFLKSRGIIARRMAGYGLADALRISIGREDEMRLVADTLSEFMS